MPKMPIDYTKTIIYKIQHKEKDNLFYIGHTTNFDSRKKEHKQNVKNGNENVYTMIRTHGGWDMFNMAPIKQVNCKDRIEALIEKQKSFDELKPTLNSTSAFNNNKESEIELKLQRMDIAYQKKKEKLIKKELIFKAKQELIKLRN